MVVGRPATVGLRPFHRRTTERPSDAPYWSDCARRPAKSGVPDLAERLYRAGAGEAVRRDASSEGALAALEVHGIDLRVLHELLVEAGDRGLRIQLASQLLADWR